MKPLFSAAIASIIGFSSVQADAASLTFIPFEGDLQFDSFAQAGINSAVADLTPFLDPEVVPELPPFDDIDSIKAALFASKSAGGGSLTSATASVLTGEIKAAAEAGGGGGNLAAAGGAIGFGFKNTGETLIVFPENSVRFSGDGDFFRTLGVSPDSPEVALHLVGGVFGGISSSPDSGEFPDFFIKNFAGSVLETVETAPVSGVFEDSTAGFDLDEDGFLFTISNPEISVEPGGTIQFLVTLFVLAGASDGSLAISDARNTGLLTIDSPLGVEFLNTPDGFSVVSQVPVPLSALSLLTGLAAFGMLSRRRA